MGLSIKERIARCMNCDFSTHIFKGSKLHIFCHKENFDRCEIGRFVISTANCKYFDGDGKDDDERG